MRYDATLKSLGEFGLIDRIARCVTDGAGVALGIGDDAAAVAHSAGNLSLITTDMLVEGVHFDLSFCDPFSLGRKSLSVNLSDIAAMGGTPRHFLLSMAVPPSADLALLDDLIRGMMQRATEFGVSLIGGDTCSSPDRLVLSLTVLGEQLPEKIVRRSGAGPGDNICVTGTVGDSALGLKLLKNGERDDFLISRHLDPTPRVREGRALADACIPSAMIDLSDGLLADLQHILDSSSAGARLREADIPLSPHFLARFPAMDDEARTMALSGGEDYELLFTVPPIRMPDLFSLMQELGTPVAVIGSVTETNGLSVVDTDGNQLPLRKKGFNHFSES
ncbi:MAG: thiamine-phosphate kinase [Geobacteraceae bacterium]|nr:thiamine-phosphate kinase [Geobacteraceae bacterium]